MSEDTIIISKNKNKPANFLVKFTDVIYRQLSKFSTKEPLLSMSRFTTLVYRMADCRMTALWERSRLRQWPVFR
jgi:hypothetical protein